MTSQPNFPEITERLLCDCDMKAERTGKHWASCASVVRGPAVLRELRRAWNAGVEASAQVTDQWPLIPANMERATKYAKHGCAHAVAATLQAPVYFAILALRLPEEPTDAE